MVYTIHYIMLYKVLWYALYYILYIISYNIPCYTRFGVGQNLYVYKQSIRRAETDWERAVQDWYEEVTLFNNSKVATT